MDVENLLIDRMYIPHNVVNITGYLSCRFSSLSHLIYGTDSLGKQVIEKIVQHVYDNWHKYKNFTMKVDGNIYQTKVDYIEVLYRIPYWRISSEIVRKIDFLKGFSNGFLLFHRFKIRISEKFSYPNIMVPETNLHTKLGVLDPRRSGE